MEDFYRALNHVIPSSSDDHDHVNVHQVVQNIPSISSTTCGTGGFHGAVDDNMTFLFETTTDHQRGQGMDMGMGMGMGSSDDHNMSDLIKTQIANHPRYPDLVSAYIQLQKVGAPPEMQNLLEEIGRVSHLPINTCSTQIGADPELDDFMESYCEVLNRYKEELSKELDEATMFLTSIESQLSNLCKGTFPKPTWDVCHSDEAGGSSEEEFSCGEVEGAAESSQETCGVHNSGDRELKDMLLHKYSGYLSGLRKEFLKKRKKGKLPMVARTALLDWWTTHYRWPYPTEEEKLQLSEVTGLDQKQINNWFINQRKRHWKPSEDMRFALMEGVSAGIGGSSMLFDHTRVGTANDDM